MRNQDINTVKNRSPRLSASLRQTLLFGGCVLVVVALFSLTLVVLRGMVVERARTEVAERLVALEEALMSETSLATQRSLQAEYAVFG
ncbi:MAG: hypothetical protein AAF531_24205, partial [Actinomycetota bacterium]